MKFKVLFFVLAIQLYTFTPLHLYCEQKLSNITEDTLAEDSYRPVAGKEFLVAVRMVDEIEGQEQPVSNETIIFQTSIGTLSELEVITNIYGEAITWLTTSAVPETTHSITATVKDKPEIQSVSIEVKNIALPQDAPTAEELIQQVEENNAKIQDIKGDITVTSSTGATRILKIWQKGEKQKVQEIAPNPEIFIQPIDTFQIPQMSKDIVSYNQIQETYVVQTKEENQQQQYPALYDFVNSEKNIIFKKLNYQEQEDSVSKFSIEDSDFVVISDCLVFKKEEQIFYQGTSGIGSTDEYQYSNVEVNTGIPDSEFE